MIRFEDGVFFLQRVEEAAPVVVVTVLDDHESVPRQLRSSLLFCNSISRFFFFSALFPVPARKQIRSFIDNLSNDRRLHS